jgi:hypothetical protein
MPDGACPAAPLVVPSHNSGEKRRAVDLRYRSMGTGKESVNSTGRVAQQIQQDSRRLTGETLGEGAQPFTCGHQAAHGKIGNRDAALQC